MASKLRLRLETRTTAHLVWTETEHGFECGPLCVKPWKSESGKWAWGIFFRDNMIGRPYGYCNARDAKNAAPHCREVRAIINGKDGE